MGAVLPLQPQCEGFICTDEDPMALLGVSNGLNWIRKANKEAKNTTGVYADPVTARESISEAPAGGGAHDVACDVLAKTMAEVIPMNPKKTEFGSHCRKADQNILKSGKDGEEAK